MSKKLLLNNKLITIKNLPKGKQGVLLIAEIKNICSNKGFSWLYPSVTFSFEEGLHKPHVSYEKKYIVHIPIEEWEEKKFHDVIIHELVHIFQHNSTQSYPRFVKGQKRLHSLMLKLGQLIEDESSDLLPLIPLRLILRIFIYEIMLEGPARFFDFSKGKKFTDEKKLLTQMDEYAEIFYTRAKLGTVNFLTILEDLKSKLKNGTASLDEAMSIKDNFSSYVYDIGLHVSFTLILYGNLTLKRLVSMSIYKQIREYEKVALELKISPVLSLNSGVGIFDYQRELSALNGIYKDRQAK